MVPEPTDAAAVACKRTESNSNQGEEPLVMIAFGSPGLMCECEWRVEQQPCAQSVM